MIVPRLPSTIALKAYCIDKRIFIALTQTCHNHENRAISSTPHYFLGLINKHPIRNTPRKTNSLEETAIYGARSYLYFLII